MYAGMYLTRQLLLLGFFFFVALFLVSLVCFNVFCRAAFFAVVFVFRSISVLCVYLACSVFFFFQCPFFFVSFRFAFSFCVSVYVFIKSKNLRQLRKIENFGEKNSCLQAL